MKNPVRSRIAILFFLPAFAAILFNVFSNHESSAASLFNPTDSFISGESLSAAGDLDMTFNAIGTRIDGYGNGADEIYASALQSDGKIIVAGRSAFGSTFPVIVARFNVDGSLDTTFNGNGRLYLTGKLVMAYAVSIQPDGKIVVAGTIFSGQFSDFAVVRLNSNGTLDTSFGVNGGVSTPITLKNDTARAVAIQPDGKIIAAGADENPNLSGFFEFAVVRYNADGSLDGTFGSGGKVRTLLSSSSSARSLALQADGKIVAAGGGSDLAAVVRYDTSGNPDSTFDGDGIATLASYVVNSVAMQSDGKILAAGAPSFGSIQLAAFRFNSNGSLDNSFSGDGIAIASDFGTNTAISVLIGSGGLITLSGNNQSNYSAVRFDTNGNLDIGFGTNGLASTSIGGSREYLNAASLQTDGKLIVVGYSEFLGGITDIAMARFGIDGNLDPTFDGDGRTVAGFGENAMLINAVAIQADQKIVSVGRHFIPDTSSNNWNFAVTRYNVNGSLDTAFGTGGKVSFGYFNSVSDYATSAVIQPDQKIIVAGYISGGFGANYILIRLNSDGSLDSSFNGIGKVLTDLSPGQDYGNSIALQSNGKIVVGGYSTVGSSTDFSVARYNTDGSLDTTFNGTGFAITPVGIDADQANSVLVQPDGKVVLAGYSFVNNVPNFSLIRYNENGTLDTTFGTGGKAFVLTGSTNSIAYAAVLQTDGKIVLGGNVNSGADFSIARFNANGTLDNGFGSSGFTNVNISSFDQINAVAVQSNGKIVAGGETGPGTAITHDFATLRFNPNGTLDTSFGNAGKVVTDLSGSEDGIQGIAIGATGKIVATGRGNGLAGIAQYTGDPVVARSRPFDFDGDGKTDLSIFRPSGASGSEWWVSTSSNGGNFATQFGSSTDRIAPADYTGDGKTDVAFWRPSNGFWFVLRSEDFSFYSFPFGTTGDVPVPADYDGDGKADAAVFRESNLTWYINKSSGGTTITTFGTPGDVPVAADYDGDGKVDVAIYRPNGTNGTGLGEWWIQRTSTGVVFATQFGNPTDKTVQGDFTGDGKADIAFWRPSTGFWNILRSEDSSYFAFPFGANGDVPVPGDYDGDGKFDAGVFRQPGAQWFVNKSTGGTLIQSFGIAGDLPLPNAFVR